MSKSRQQVADALISGNYRLQSVWRQAQQLAQLNTLVSSYLGSQLSQHCTIAGIKGEQLIVYADSPAWATRLRYQSTDLITTFKQHPELSRITQIVCRVLSSPYGCIDEQNRRN